jgi:hypothetical protein
MTAHACLEARSGGVSPLFSTSARGRCVVSFKSWPLYTWDDFACLYVDDVCTSQEAHLWVSTACYGHSLTFLYVADVRTSQEARIWASTV